MQALRRHIDALICAAIAAASLMSMLHLYFQRFYNTDFGIFAYGGMALNRGAVIYRDFWDNKSPAIFELNALALRLFGDSPWAIRNFEVLFLAVSMICLFWALRDYGFGRGASFGGALVFLSVITVPSFLEGGNMTEEYASYLMACALLPLSISVQAGTGRAKELLMLLIAGFILCLTIFLKEPFILNFPAFMILALSSEGNIRKSILRILVMLGGALLCACFFIAANFNALGEWLKVIDYNVHYSGGGIPMLQKMLLLFKVIFLWYIPLNFLVFAFCLAALIVSAASGAFRNPAAKFRTDARARLLAFAAVLFITASLASGIQGKFFGHYFLALTLPVALAAVFSLELCFRNKILRAALALSIVLALGYALLFESLGLRHSKCDVLAKLTSFPGWFFRTLNPVGARFTYPPLIGRGILLVDFPDNVIREREFILDVINGDKSDFTIQNYSDFTLVYLLTGKMSAARHFMYFPHFFIDSSSSTGKEKLDGHIGEIREKRPKYIIKEKYEIPYVPSDYRRIEMSYYDLLIRPD